nr:reverse transcriptase domain-containing protein [Tanacetum cinerariifolium]
MSAMANTTPLVTTVRKPATNPRDTDTTPRDRQKDVHTRLDFGEGPRERAREDSHYSSARARTTKPERVRVQDRLRYDNRCVLDRLRHRRQSAFDRLSETYSPSTTKSHPREADSKDLRRGRNSTHDLNTSREDRPKDRERFRSIGESYDDSFSHSCRDENRSRHMKRRRDNKSLLSSVSRSDSSDGRYRRTRMPNNVKTYDGTGDPENHVKKFQAAARVERWVMPTRCYMFNSALIGAARVWFDELPPESIDSYKGLKAAFLAYFMQQNKYVKDPVEIHNIKQRDGETIEDFMERFKVETGRIKGAPECMRISGFMHGVNNPELTKRLNEHVPKTIEEMMIITTAFIRGEAAAASKKKGHVSWKAHDQSKRQNLDKRSDFQGHSKEGMGSNRFTPLTRTPKEILAAEASKFQPSPPMVTPVEKRSSNKLCDFHNDKGHNTDEYMQLKKQIEELVRAGKLSHLIKEIKQGRDQSKIGKKETAVNDKPATIYIVHLWQRTIRQNVTQRGIVTIRNTILIPTEYASVITSSVVPNEERTRPANFKVALHPDFPDQEVAIGGTLSDKGRTELCSILKKNLDIFAWQPTDMTGVPRSVAEHRLNLREGYSPDCYPLPEIDWKVESLCGYPFKCFLDAYKGYHQIQSAEPDEEKTAFHTGQGVYCYTKMPFGLKNVGGTYQRLMDKAFEGQIGQNIEVYVDDLVVKSYTKAKMIRDIEETFRTLRKVNMKLNPKKCSFGLAEGIILGYVVTPEGIKPCPDKTAVVLQLPSPRTIKEVQSLNGKLASLNRFLSKSAEKSLPLFQTLKKCIKKSDFHWTAEAEQAFKQLKHHLSELPLLVAPRPKEELIIYLSATYGAIREHNITYRPRTSIKGQILADFLIEMSGEDPQAASAAETQEQPWTLFTNGSSCVDRSSAGIILTNPEGVEFTYALRFQFVTSNNEAEYEALIAGLRIVTRMGVKDVHASVDSKLVANQMLGTYVAKEDNMVKYLEIVKRLLRALVEPGTGRSAQRQIYKGEGGGNGDRGRRTDQDDTVSRLSKRRDSPRRQEGCEKTPPQGPTIRVNGGSPLQTVVPYAVVKMYWTVPGGVCNKGNPRRVLQHARGTASNGLMERVNRSLGEGIKSRLGDGNKNWVKELPHVLWAHRTMIKSSHDDTPFSLTYGTEAVIPTEIEMPTYRTAAVDVAKSKMMKYYNARVRGITFKPGNFVYRSNDASHAVAGGKLGLKWEGPYKETEALGNGAYKLRSIDETILPRTWNIANLKRCYL